MQTKYAVIMVILYYFTGPINIVIFSSRILKNSGCNGGWVELEEN